MKTKTKKINLKSNNFNNLHYPRLIFLNLLFLFNIYKAAPVTSSQLILIYIIIYTTTMLAYKESIHSLKEILIGGDAIFLTIRLFSQQRFTVPTALEIIQVLVAGLIYCRNYCSVESQVYC